MNSETHELGHYRLETSLYLSLSINLASQSQVTAFDTIMMKLNGSTSSTARNARVCAISIARPELAPVRGNAGPIMSEGLKSRCDLTLGALSWHAILPNLIDNWALACSRVHYVTLFGIHPDSMPVGP